MIFGFIFQSHHLALSLIPELLSDYKVKMSDLLDIEAEESENEMSADEDMNASRRKKRQLDSSDDEEDEDDEEKAREEMKDFLNDDDEEEDTVRRR